MRAIGVCVGDVKIGKSEGLGPRWPIPNSWEKGEGKEDDEEEDLRKVPPRKSSLTIRTKRSFAFINTLF